MLKREILRGRLSVWCVCFFLLGSGVAFPERTMGIDFSDRDSLIIIRSRSYEIALSKKNGALNYILDKKTNQRVVLGSQEDLLWQVKFAAGKLIKSSQFSLKEKTFSYGWSAEKNKLDLTYNSSDLSVKVALDFRVEGQFEATIFVENRNDKYISNVWFPCDINFSIDRLNRFIYPHSVGVALQPSFFKEIERAGRYQTNMGDFKPCPVDFGYPGPLFSDFVFLDSRSGKVAIYLVQTKQIMETPWLMIGCSQKKKGLGRYDHKFQTYIPAGSHWQSSVLRFEVGKEIRKVLENYAQANKIDRSPTLKGKLGSKFDRLASSVMLQYNPRDGMNSIDSFSKLNDLFANLPVPSLIHYVSENVYSDLLLDPLSGDLSNFIADNISRGHLLMPFTVWTWLPSRGFDLKELGCWVDREGNLWTDTWHFAPEHGGAIATLMTSSHSAELRNLLRGKVKKYVEEHKIDLLFEDAVGAMWNAQDFNPASPDPTAYTQGLIDIVKEHSRIIPLMTEKGFDLLTPIETGFCGLTHGLLKSGGRLYEMRLCLGDNLTEDYWRIYPLAQYLSHPYVAFYHHNLGGNVITKHDLSMSLILGYNLIKSFYFDDAWLKIDDAIQKAVCSRYFGKKLTDFIYLSPKVIRSRYEDIEIVANLSTDNTYDFSPSTIIAREGFLARSLDGKMLSGIFRKFNGLEYNHDLLVIQEQEKNKLGLKFFTFDSVKPLQIKLKRPQNWLQKEKITSNVPIDVQDKWLSVDVIPEICSAEPVVPLPAECKAAPYLWEERPKYIGVIDLPGCEFYSGTDLRADDWMKALGNSRMVKEGNVQLRTINSIEKLYEICKKKNHEYLIIINPYGASFPVRDLSNWRESIGQVRSFIRNGGIWWETGGLPATYLIYADKQGLFKRKKLGYAALYELFKRDIDGQRIVEGSDYPAGDIARGKPHEVALTFEGKEWLGGTLEKQIAGQSVVANTAIPENVSIKKLVLLSTRIAPYITGYQLGGWGWLFRVEGEGKRGVVLKVAPKVCDHIYFSEPTLLPFDGIGYKECVLEYK